MSKPRPKRIPSDKCGVVIDGEICFPHEGEWVELVTSQTVAELRARVRFARLAADIDGIRGEPDEVQQFDALMDTHYAELVDHLSERIFSWNWTDIRSRPLPSPVDDDGKPLGLLKLRAGELYWLLSAASVENQEERKND